MPALPSGSAQLHEIAVRLRAAGAGVQLNAVRAELRAEGKPLVDAARAAALEKLPKSGGLNEWVASQRFTISTLTGARTAGVRLVGPRNIKSGGQTNRGYVRHPVWGNRGAWVTEQIPQAAGWWTDTLTRESPKVTPRLYAVLQRVARFIMYGGL